MKLGHVYLIASELMVSYEAWTRVLNDI